MAREIQNSISEYIRSTVGHDPEECCRFQDDLNQAVRILSTEGVSLTSLQASFLSSSTPWETSLYFQQLTELLTLVHDDKGQHMLDAFSQQVLQDTSYTTTHSIRDQGDRKVGPTTAEGTPSTTAAGAWSLQTATEEQRHKIWAPWIIRHWLAHSLQPLQLCGLVGQPRVKQALQGLLSFVDYQHLAVQPGAAAGPVLSLLPAAVRAWILADVAAGLLLADDNGSRYKLTNSPQHCDTLLMLSQQLTTGQQQYTPQLQLNITERFQRQQQCSQLTSIWKQFQAFCNILGLSCHSSSNSWQSPAASLIAIVRALVSMGSSNSNSSSSSRGGKTSSSTLSALLPCDAAAHLAVDIECGGSNSSSNDPAEAWHQLHAYLSMMSTALLQKLQQKGSRLGLQMVFNERQQVQLQSALMRMLAPVQQEATAAAAAAAVAALQADQQQQQQHQESNSKACDSDVTSNQLDPAHLQCTLTNVQDFIAAVHTVKEQQQHQVLEQLKQRLEQLHDAVMQPNISRDRVPACSSRSSSSSSAEERSSWQQLVTPPDVAELIGLGNLEQLMQLEIDLQWSRYPILTASGQQALLKKLLAAPVGAVLRDYYTYNDEDECDVPIECSVNPQLLLEYWWARSHSVTAAGRGRRGQLTATDDLLGFSGALPDSWGVLCKESHVFNRGRCEDEQLRMLLEQHSGLGWRDIEELVQICCEMSELLAELEWAGAHVQGKQAVHAVTMLVRTAGGSNSSGFGPHEVLPGFRLQTVHKPLSGTASSSSSQSGYSGGSEFVDHLAGLNNAFGPLATSGLASLLVRAALAQLPGQQQQQQQGFSSRLSDGHDSLAAVSAAVSAAVASAAAARINKELLHERLLARLDMLRNIYRPLAQAYSNSKDSQAGDRLRWQREHTLSSFLEEAVPECLPLTTSGQLAQLHDVELQLMRHVLDAAGLQPGDTRPAAMTGLSAWSKLQVFELLAERLKPSGQCFQNVLAKHLAIWGSSSSRVVRSITCSSSTTTTTTTNDAAGHSAETARGVCNRITDKRVSSSSSSATNGADSCDADHLSSCSIGTISSDDEDNSSVSVEHQPGPADFAEMLAQLSRDVVSSLPNLLQALEIVVAKAAHRIISASTAAQQAANTALQVAAQSDAAHAEVAGWASWSDQQLEKEYDGKLLERLHELSADFEMASGLSDRAITKWATLIKQVGKQADAVAQLLHSFCSVLLDHSRTEQQQQQLCDSSVLAWRIAALFSTLEQIESSRHDALAASVNKARTAAVDAMAVRGLLDEASKRKDKSLAGMIRAVAADTCRLSALQPDEKARHNATAAAAAQSIEAATAAGLGLLAMMGLWVVPEWGPTPALPTAVAAAAAAADQHSTVIGSRRKTGFNRGSDRSETLLTAVKQLGHKGVERVASILAFLSGAGSSSSSSSALSAPAAADSDEEGVSDNPSSRASSSSRRGLAGVKLAAIVQQHCSELVGPGTSHSSAAARAAALNADTHDCLSKQAVWGLLATLKPGVARAMHFQQLPAPCRTFENFQAAVNSWPPVQHKQQQQRTLSSSSSSSSKGCCSHCGQNGGIPAHYHRPASCQGSGAMATFNPITSAVCTAAGCVTRELQQRAEGGPPMALLMSQQWYPLLDAAMTVVQASVPHEFRHLTKVVTGTAAAQTPNLQQQQQQYARALQISLCKSGTPAGLVRRLLLLEAIRHPDQASLLHPKLLPAWREQQAMELSRVAVPAGHKRFSSATAAGPAAYEQWQGPTSGCRSTFYSDGCHSRSQSAADDHRAQLQGWHPDIYDRILAPFEQLLLQQQGYTCYDTEATAPCDVYAWQYAKSCCFSAACRAALCCWVLCWHCCVEERGGAYDCVTTRAAAAEAASELISPDQLQHIRLPAWAYILPAPTPAENPGNSSSNQQPCVWWNQPSSRNSTAPTNSRHYSNQRWCQALQEADSEACQGVCDCCGQSWSACSNSSSQTADRGPGWCCPCCGVAVYCSKSCAGKDKQNHRRECRLLTRLSGAAGLSMDWEMLTAEPGAAAAPRALKQSSLQ